MTIYSTRYCGMKFKVVKRCQEDLSSIHGLLKSFLPFARKRMGFNKPPTIFFKSDQGNAQKLLGKTAHYEPATGHITVYVTGRHPKDVLRSLSHELVHHGQNCRGEFGHTPDTAPGYAQTDNHMRKMEEEAYSVGNLCFRDWEDSVKSGKIPVSMKLQESKRNTLSILEDITASYGAGSRVSRDENVAVVQSLLKQDNPNSLPIFGIDGVFRDETEGAIKDFQRDKNINPSGMVDEETYSALVQAGNLEDAKKQAKEVVQRAATFGGAASQRGTISGGDLGVLTLRQGSVSPSKLFQDLVKAGVGRELAKAAVANAKGESYSTSAGNIEIANVGDNGCSLGLWQFNICGGLGVDVMRKLGISIEKNGYQGVYDRITDYDTQIDFMSNYITNVNIPSSNIKTAHDLTRWFVYNVEKPADKPDATIKRQRFLRNFESQGVFDDKGPATSRKPGGILYFGDSQMGGNLGRALISIIGRGTKLAKGSTTASYWVVNEKLKKALSSKPTKIIISLGGNGVGDASGLLRLIKEQAPNANVVWSGAPPPIRRTQSSFEYLNSDERYSEAYENRKKRNDVIKNLVEAEGFTFIDPYNYLLLPDPKIIDNVEYPAGYECKGCDGIHLPRDVAFDYVNAISGKLTTSLQEWKNKELNRLLLEKFNLGVTK